MSRLIKSNQVKIGDEKLIIPASITISKEVYLGMHPEGMPSRVSQDQDFGGDIDSSEFQEGIFEHQAGEARTLDEAQAAIDKMFENAQLEVDTILQEARESALAIEASALDQSKSLFDKTYQEAYAQGYDQGKEDAAKAHQHHVEEALNLKKQWQDRLEALIPDLEYEAVRLVLASVEKIIGESTAPSDYIQQLIRVGFKEIHYATSVTIKVCERDYEFALSTKELALAMSKTIEEISFRIDHALEPGQVLIETENGSVDVSLQTQLENLRNLFMDLLKSEAHA